MRATVGARICCAVNRSDGCSILLVDSDNANYVYDASNRLKEIRNTGGGLVHQLSYDVQGNLANKNSVGHDFDFGNRLREVTGQEYYRYDSMGRRVLALRPVGGSTLSMYSQEGQVPYQHSEPLQKSTENIYLGGSLVASREWSFTTSTLTTKYQHTDALGSPVAVTNESGTVIERINYDPYGGPIGKVVEGVGYTGHVMDPTTGLTYMQQRYYDAGIGQFLSVDPITVNTNTGEMFNRYSYAANSPYVFIDPDGRKNGRVNRNPTLTGLNPKERLIYANILIEDEGLEVTREIRIGVSPDGSPSGGAMITGSEIVLGDSEFATRSKLHATLHHEAGHDSTPAIQDGSYSDYYYEEAEMYQLNIDNADEYGSTPSEREFFETERDSALENAKKWEAHEKRVESEDD